MAKLNYIGLDEEASKKLANKLNSLLANYSMFYINTRGFHWNIKGEKFFELHAKFEELYDNLILKIDEIAERIITLGETPYHTYSKYVQLSEIKEATNVSDGLVAVDEILKSFQIIIMNQREILAMADEMNDEGTNSLMSDYISEQEKLVWMYAAFRNK